MRRSGLSLRDELPEPIIVVRLHGNLRRFLPSGHEMLRLSPQTATTVAVLLTSLGLPQEEVAMVGVNGRLAGMTQPLAPGDQVDVFAPVAGGSWESGDRSRHWPPMGIRLT